MIPNPAHRAKLGFVALGVFLMFLNNVQARPLRGLAQVESSWFHCNMRTLCATMGMRPQDLSFGPDYLCVDLCAAVRWGRFGSSQWTYCKADAWDSTWYDISIEKEGTAKCDPKKTPPKKPKKP